MASAGWARLTCRGQSDTGINALNILLLHQGFFFNSFFFYFYPKCFSRFGSDRQELEADLYTYALCDATFCCASDAAKLFETQIKKFSGKQLMTMMNKILSVHENFFSSPNCCRDISTLLVMVLISYRKDSMK